MPRRSRNRPSPPAPAPLREVTDAEIDDTIAWAMTATTQAQVNALHDLFNKQVREVLDEAGLTEEEKQTVLVAMACPCCGAGSASFNYKLRPKEDQT